MKTTIKILFAIFLFLTLQNTYAEEIQKASAEIVDMTFEQAYEIMMTNNNAIKAVLEEINVKRYEKNAAVGEFFPKIGINTAYMHLGDEITVKPNDVSLMGLTIPVDSIKLQGKNLWETSFGATWNIFTGGRIIALNSAARAKYELTNEKFKSVTNHLIVELVRRYYGLKLAKDMVTVRGQIMMTVKNHLDDALKLEEAGIIPKSERLHAEVAYRQAVRDYNSALRDVDIAQDGLKALIKADEIDLDGVEINPISSFFVYREDLASLDEFKDLALLSNPSLKQLNSKSKIANAAYRGQVGTYLPTVSLFAYDIVANSELSYQVPRFAVGAAANWELFSGFSRYNKIKAADSFRKQVEFEKLDAKNNIEALVNKDYQEYLKYKEQYDSTNKSIENANEALRVASLAFKEGFGTSLSVTDAAVALLTTRLQRLNSIYNTDVILTELLSTNGTAENILEYIKKSEKEEL